VNFLARVVSVLFHPLLIPTYLFGILALALPSALAPIQPSAHLKFILMIFIVTFVLPLFNVAIFKFFGTVDSFTLENRKERILPFTFVLVIYIAITYLLYSKAQISLDDNFLKLMIVMDLLGLASLIATLFFKVSVHSIGIWGLIGIMMPLTKMSEVNALFYVSLGLIALAGIIMSSRLLLGAHNSREVMWGSVIGLATSVTGMLFLFQQ
jgi:hypothetical protein